MTKLQWGRPERQGSRLVYRSKCGRYTIERREYVLPTVSVGYKLTGPGCPDSGIDCDTLRDAKEYAQDLATPEN